MKKKYLLPLYFDWIKTGKLPGGRGLCKEFPMFTKERDMLYLFSPSTEMDEMITHLFWASGFNFIEKIGEFTPMRQNIVLLMAAMAGEL